MPEVREWTVAGGLVESGGRLLMVRNRRRGGREDWSTPGGVIDAADASIVDGLTREVEEETGIRVARWEGPLYEVVAHAPDLAWRMRCEVHLALGFRGDLRVEDPDGIVVEAAFVSRSECLSRLVGCPLWVREPLTAWITDRWRSSESRTFSYEVHGTDLAALRVVRIGV